MTDLIVLAESTALEAFQSTDGLDPIIQQVKDAVNDFEHDMSTDASRKRTASIAAKVRKVKTKLDAMGKGLTEEWAKKKKVVDVSRKGMRDTLDELALEARLPLTEWEDEQKRIKAEEEATKAAEELAKQIKSDEEIAHLLDKEFDRNIAEKSAAEQAATKAREDEMKRQASETARIKAETKAKAEQGRIEKEKADAVFKAEEAERQRIATEERAKLEAENAEIRRVAAEAKAKQDTIDSAERARQAEIQRQKDEQAQLEKEQAKLEANRAYVGQVRKQAKVSLMAIGLDEETAKKVVLAIAKNKIVNVTINY